MIKSIRLRNCQSWEDGTINLSNDRLNVIKAPNNVGKSVLMKMLKVSVSPQFFGAKKRKKLIRWGAQYAEVIYLFTDNSLAVVRVYQTRVLYYFKGADDPSFTGSVVPPQQLIEHLGLMVSRDMSFIANIIDTDQNLLLVDSDAKATYDFTQMLCNNASLDDYLSKLKEEQTWCSDKVSLVDFRLSSLRERLANVAYTDLYTMENKIKTVIVTKELLTAFVLGAKCLNRIEDATRDKKNYDNLLRIADVLQKIEGVRLQRLVTWYFDNALVAIVEMLEAFERIAFKNFRLPHYKPDAVKLLSILEKLDTITMEKMYTRKPMAGTDLCDVLCSIERISLQRLGRMQRPPSMDAVLSLEYAERSAGSLYSFSKHIGTAEAAMQEAERLEVEFKNAGREYDCDVYGKVIFNGKECVPYNY